jgi:hypothetical protein
LYDTKNKATGNTGITACFQNKKSGMGSGIMPAETMWRLPKTNRPKSSAFEFKQSTGDPLP